MIKYNNSNINDWFYNSSDIIKVYHNGAVCYYKIASSGGTQVPCYAVVDDISQYSETEFEDVFNKADEKWYKLNNLNQYEQYGVYGSGRNITYYEGKLTIDGDYEYQYSGSSWVNVGEISGDTPYDYSQDYLTLQALESGTIGFSVGTVDYSTDSGSTWNTLAQGNTISVSQGDEVLFKKSGSIPTENYGIGTFTSSCRFNVYGNIMSMQEGDNFATATTIANYEFYFKRLFAESKVVSAENMVLPATTLQNFCYNELFKDATYLTTPPKIFPATALTRDCYSFAFKGCTSLRKSPILPALTAARASYGWMFQDSTSLSEVTCLATDVSDMFATYDWLSNVASSGTFYKNPNASWDRGDNGIPYGWNVEDYVEPTPSVYPVYYDEIQDPPSAVTFSSMTEAESMECPYVGLPAIIDGDKYIFSGDSTSGYEWVYKPSRLPIGYTEVEYISNDSASSIPAYINTNYYPNNNTRVIADFQYTIGGTHKRLLGCGVWNWEIAYVVEAENSMSESTPADLYLRYGYDASYSWITTGAYIDMNRHTIDFNKNLFYMDNQLIHTCEPNTFTAEYPMALFGYLTDTFCNGTDEYMLGRFYSCQIYDNDVLVRNFVPCTRDSDSKAGMYDIVNDVFYISPNNELFTAGPTV